MSETGYQKLIKTANEYIPFYTSHLDNLRGFIQIQNEGKALLTELNPKADLKIFEVLEELNGVNALITISLLDLLVVCKHMCLVEQYWERAYFIKNGYLIVHETIMTYSKSKQKPLRKIIESKYPSF